MGILTFIIKIITFPGAFSYAFLEHLACRMYGIPIEFSKYFQKNELCGHVEHILAPKKGSFGVCFMPHIINLFCGIVFSIPAAMNIVYLGKFNTFGLIYLFVGFSFLMNCFPLIEDVINMWENLYGKNNNSKLIAKIFLSVPAAIMYLGAYLQHYFINIITTLGFIYFVPYVFYLFIE